MQREALLMSPRDAKAAAMPVRMLPDPRERCSLLLALAAALKRRFPSAPEKTDLFIAAIAMPR